MYVDGQGLTSRIWSSWLQSARRQGYTPDQQAAESDDCGMRCGFLLPLGPVVACSATALEVLSGGSWLGRMVASGPAACLGQPQHGAQVMRHGLGRACCQPPQCLVEDRAFHQRR